jgi:hypothetical protein
MRPSLTASEREVHFSKADDESEWTIFTDSSRHTRRLLTVAARWGVAPRRLGEGYQLALPLAAVRFVGPPSERRALRKRGADGSSVVDDAKGTWAHRGV